MDKTKEKYLNQIIAALFFIGAGAFYRANDPISIIMVAVGVFLSLVFFYRSFQLQAEAKLESIPDREKCNSCQGVLSSKELSTNFCYTCGKTAKK